MGLAFVWKIRVGVVCGVVEVAQQETSLLPELVFLEDRRAGGARRRDVEYTRPVKKSGRRKVPGPHPLWLMQLGEVAPPVAKSFVSDKPDAHRFAEQRIRQGGNLKKEAVLVAPRPELSDLVRILYRACRHPEDAMASRHSIEGVVSKLHIAVCLSICSQRRSKQEIERLLIQAGVEPNPGPGQPGSSREEKRASKRIMCYKCGGFGHKSNHCMATSQSQRPMPADRVAELNHELGTGCVCCAAQEFTARAGVKTCSRCRHAWASHQGVSEPEVGAQDSKCSSSHPVPDGKKGLRIERPVRFSPVTVPVVTPELSPSDKGYASEHDEKKPLVGRALARLITVDGLRAARRGDSKSSRRPIVNQNSIAELDARVTAKALTCSAVGAHVKGPLADLVTPGSLKNARRGDRTTGRKPILNQSAIKELDERVSAKLLYTEPTLRGPDSYSESRGFKGRPENPMKVLDGMDFGLTIEKIVRRRMVLDEDAIVRVQHLFLDPGKTDRRLVGSRVASRCDYSVAITKLEIETDESSAFIKFVDTDAMRIVGKTVATVGLGPALAGIDPMFSLVSAALGGVSLLGAIYSTWVKRKIVVTHMSVCNHLAAAVLAERSTSNPDDAFKLVDQYAVRMAEMDIPDALIHEVLVGTRVFVKWALEDQHFRAGCATGLAGLGRAPSQ